jgi:peptide deformylase
MGRVPRAESILVEYQDASGDRHHERMNGYLARVVQHECDHLEGAIFLDRMTSMDSISTIANYARFHAPAQGAGS